jgi:hypothetical protein
MSQGEPILTSTEYNAKCVQHASNVITWMLLNPEKIDRLHCNNLIAIMAEHYISTTDLLNKNLKESTLTALQIKDISSEGLSNAVLHSLATLPMKIAKAFAELVKQDRTLIGNFAYRKNIDYIVESLQVDAITLIPLQRKLSELKVDYLTTVNQLIQEFLIRYGLINAPEQ